MMSAAIPSVWRRLWYTRLRDAMRGRFDASLDWRLVVAEADLPSEINDAIDEVVRRTRLWGGEKVAVAAELVAHFQDGLDAGCLPEELLKSFGELPQAAQLIGRAKKRGRSLGWQLWRYAYWAFGSLLVIYVAAGLYMAMGRPAIKTDYLAIFNQRAAAVPESDRAWPIYRDALLAMDVKPDKFDFARPIGAATTSKPGDADWPEVQKFLTDHADEMAGLREAAARQELGFILATTHAAYSEKDRDLFDVTVAPEEIDAFKRQTLEDRWLISTLLPYLNVLRPAATLLASDAQRAAAAGDGDTALADITAIYGVSRHCEQSPILISVVVAEGVQQLARSAIRDILRDYPELWTNAQLRDLAHRTAAARIDWRRGFQGERVCFQDSMQRIYTDDGHSDGRLALYVSKDHNLFELLNFVSAGDSGQHTSTPLSNAGLALLAMPATNMVVASRKEMTDMYLQFSDRALERLEKPLWETTDSPSLDDELLALHSEPFGKIRYLFVNLLMPAYDKVRSRYATSQGEREGVFIGLALELYHREHDKWPASLQELSPRWLPEVPVDRITGKPLKYLIVDDRPVVYCAGVDGDDDGGRLPDDCEGDATAYRVSPPSEIPSKATDLVRGRHDGDWVIWSTTKQFR
jgi:hypothetical protein